MLPLEENRGQERLPHVVFKAPPGYYLKKRRKSGRRPPIGAHRKNYKRNADSAFPLVAVCRLDREAYQRVKDMAEARGIGYTTFLRQIIYAVIEGKVILP